MIEIKFLSIVPLSTECVFNKMLVSSHLSISLKE